MTAKEVTIVAYLPSEAQLSAGTASSKPVNRATGQPTNAADAIADMQKVYDYAQENFGTYQLWGRTPKLEFITASGTDEAAQRADAVEAINLKPFMVVDMTATGTGGAPVFASTIAARKIVVFSASTTATNGADQSPYRWNYGADNDAGSILTAAFLGRSLAGHKAQWAGDTELASKPRKFGLVYPTTGFDLDAFQAEMKKNGGGAIADSVGYDPADPTAADQTPTLVSKLKSAGVTSVVLFANNAEIAPLMKSATAQEYSPEWVLTGFGYQEYDLFARSYDPEQSKHMFGLSVLFPAFKDIPDYLDVYNWYWGKTQGNFWANGARAVHLRLHRDAVRRSDAHCAEREEGVVLRPGHGWRRHGYPGVPDRDSARPRVCRTTSTPPTAPTARSCWYDPDTTGVAQAANLVGKGVMMYMDAGKRYSYKSFPKGEPKFFDEKGSLFELSVAEQFPDVVLPAASPCTECPSSGATG